MVHVEPNGNATMTRRINNHLGVGLRRRSVFGMQMEHFRIKIPTDRMEHVVGINMILLWRHATIGELELWWRRIRTASGLSLNLRIPC